MKFSRFIKSNIHNNLLFYNIYNKHLFNFFNKNKPLNNKTAIDIKDTNENKNKNDLMEKAEEKKDLKEPPKKIIESKINKYYRDDIKKYDGRLN
jgi:hypothetical protein